MTRTSVLAILSVGLLAMGTVGCGGEVNDTHEGRLEEGDDLQQTDNSFQDRYTFRTSEGFQIDIQMNSDELDSYLMLVSPDGVKIGENDDAVAGENNARIQMSAPASGTYTVFANTFEAGDTGAYTLTVRATETAAETTTETAETTIE